ncbi:MAG: calcium-binding protein [Nitrospirae bacterium]|nr:calcium-binding protein [Magnetococcales bacterium]
MTTPFDLDVTATASESDGGDATSLTSGVTVDVMEDYLPDDAITGNGNLTGTAGDDIIRGGDGSDHLLGEAGDDSLAGGAGNDHLEGGAGDDQLSGGSGNDTLEGGAGDDILGGGTGDDTLSGGDGDDHLMGGQGDDIMDGGAGNDVFLGGAGDDIMTGGDGDDLFIFGHGGGLDYVDGGSGDGWLDSIQLGDVSGGPAESIEHAGDWTLDSDNAFTMNADQNQIDFNDPNASGTITLDDGSIIEFHNIDHIQW